MRKATSLALKNQSGGGDSSSLEIVNFIMSQRQYYLRPGASSRSFPAANASYAAPPSYKQLPYRPSSSRSTKLQPASYNKPSSPGDYLQRQITSSCSIVRSIDRRSSHVQLASRYRLTLSYRRYSPSNRSLNASRKHSRPRRLTDSGSGNPKASFNVNQSELD